MPNQHNVRGNQDNGLPQLIDQDTDSWPSFELHKGILIPDREAASDVIHTDGAAE